MGLKLKGSTDGSVSLQAPADTSPSGTDVTLTLPTSDGDANQVLQTNGSGTLSWEHNNQLDFTAASNLNTLNAVDFTGISANCKRITISFRDVSMASNGTQPRIRLGTSGGIVSTGYEGAGAFVGETSHDSSIMPASGFAICTDGFSGSGNVFTGQAVLTNITGNQWVYTCITATVGTLFPCFVAGHIDLSGTVTTVRFTQNDTTNFDQGNVAIYTEESQ